MYLKVTYEQEFDDLIMHLKSKYPKKLFDIDGIGQQTDMSIFSQDFFSSKVASDVSIDANANVDDVSNIAYNTELPKPFFRLNSYYVLWKYAKRIFNLEIANKMVESNLIGDIYINDFHGVAAGSPYCYNYSTYDIMLLGLPMVKKIKSHPPKYLYSFKSQLEQFVVLASNSTLGATGLADLFVIMSYYVKNILDTKQDAGFIMTTEEDCWKYIKENIVSFIYTINQPMRANQSPFTNVSVYDDEFLKSLCPNYIFPDGTTPDINIVKQIQTLFMNTMNEELKRTPITFPVTTACFCVDENNEIMDDSFALEIANQNMEFGFINIYCGKTSTLSSCCRLRSETDNEYFNSFGSGSTKIGSLGVCTINLPRIAFKHKNDKEMFFNTLSELVDLSAKINHVKRFIVKKRIDNGNLPLYNLGFMEITKQYSTCGINGLNEAVEVMGYNILEESGQQFVLECLYTINTLNDTLQKKYKAPHNCEQIPGENVSIKLATKDKFMKIQDEYDIYSNQFIPLTVNADVLDRIRLQGMFDKHFSGGAICHVNIEQKISNASTIVDLIKTCAKQGIVYWALNMNLQQCENEHMSVGNTNTCVVCGGEITDNYTRVVGFLTNTKNWHKVRREQDYPNRKWYSL